jgi:Tfp pilus assembly protein PilF
VEANLRELLACAKDHGRPFWRSSGIGVGSNQTVQAEMEGDHGTAEFLLDVALSAIRRDDLRRAEQFASFALELSQTARAYNVLGEIAHARDDGAQALQQWERALRVDSSHYHTLINLGKYYLVTQEVGRAASYLDQAIKVDSTRPRAHHLRGLAHQAAGDHKNAVEQYRRAVTPEYGRTVPTLYLNFGTALLATSSYEEASRMLDAYVRLAPNDPEGHYQLGATYEVLAERTLNESYTYRAIDSLKTALSKRPNHPMSHYYLSKAYRRLGKYEEAELEFDLYERYLAK